MSSAHGSQTQGTRAPTSDIITQVTYTSGFQLFLRIKKKKSREMWKFKTFQLLKKE